LVTPNAVYTSKRLGPIFIHQPLSI